MPQIRCSTDRTAPGQTPGPAAPNPFEAARRQRQFLLRIVRVAFLVLFASVTLLTVLKVDTASGQQEINLALGWPVAVGVALVLALVVVFADVLTPVKKISTLFSVFFGLLAAMLATVAVGFIIDLLVRTYDIKGVEQLVGSVKVLLGIALSYLAITTVLQTQDDFRLVIPYVEFAKQIRGARPLLLDSSVLIDARIVEIAASGVLQAPVVIPRFVMGELQLLADHDDRATRAKGRRGLDVIQRLQRTPRLDVTIDETPIPGKAVDQMLVELARVTPGIVVTTDLALTRIAKIQEVGVLNLNDLASALKPPVIPGEQLSLRLVKPGEQSGQAVGYLEDGTMVVVEDGGPAVGQTVAVVVLSTLQTTAGRMVFARWGQSAPPEPETPPTPTPEPEAPEPPEAIEEPEDEPEDSDTPTRPEHVGPRPPKRADPRKPSRRSPRRG